MKLLDPVVATGAIPWGKADLAMESGLESARKVVLMVSGLEDVSALQAQEVKTPISDRRGGLLASASVIGAIIASSCCIVPLVLVLLGVSGAWVSNLTALEPYKPYFIAATAGLLGLGYWHVYFKQKADCEAGSYCADPASRWITKVALWIATAVVLLAATVNFWAPLFY